VAHNLTTAESARLFALLNLSFADGVIAFYDAKYTYNFWRPVTAIRAAATDGNPETEADPNWLPEVGNTAPDPSYPGAQLGRGGGADFLLSQASFRVQRNFRGYAGSGSLVRELPSCAGSNAEPDLCWATFPL
jgi:hypothetical protein